MQTEKERYIFPFFWLHGEDEEKLREYMKVIDESNCKAVCVESRPHPEFCGEKWWKDMDVILDEAKKRDMKVWILDDSHFPTGFANGAAMKAEDRLRRQSVYTKKFDVKKEQKQMSLNIKKVMSKVPTTFLGKFMAGTDKDSKHIFADDRLLAISARVKGEKEPRLLYDEKQVDVNQKKLTIQLPEQTEKVYVTFLTRNAGIHKSYMNMLDEESCRLLIDAVYEPHYAHYKEEFGKTILGFFSDEPELGNGVYFNNNIKMGEDFDFPWSRELEERISKRLGENWKSLISLIWDNEADQDLAAEVRFAYMDEVTRLVEKCFSMQVGNWCQEHGVEYIGHIIEDGNAHARTANSLGHYFRGLSGQHMAGIDDIGGQVLPYKEDAPAEGIGKMLGGRDGEFYHFMLGKLAGSMAAIQPEKKGRSMCEIFGNYGWGEGPRMEKYLADHFMVQGINHFVPHAFSPKPYPDKDCPPHFYANGHNPQYRAFGRVIAYMNRVCELISDGKPVLETAVLYHADGEWSGTTMLDQKVTRELMEHQIDFHVIPSDVFEEKERYHTEITSQGLEINGNCYKTLLIPQSDYIRKEMADAIGGLQDAGCKVLFVGGKPQALIGGGELPEAVKAAGVIRIEQIADSVEKEIELTPQNKRIRAYHYQNKKKEIYYFVNEDEAVYSGEIRVPYLESCYAYDAWNGTKMVQEYRAEKEDATILSMKLRPGESRIVVVEQEKETVSQRDKSLFEMMYGVEKEKIPMKKNWEIGTCCSIDYPKFSTFQSTTKFEDYGKKEKKFSGFIAYRNQINVSKEQNRRYILFIQEAGEDVELFVNGTSQGIQILPPFLYDITEAVQDGENDIRIEVATTLERERGANKGKQEPTGITGTVEVYQI